MFIMQYITQICNNLIVNMYLKGSNMQVVRSKYSLVKNE